MTKKIVKHLVDPLFRQDIVFLANCPFTDVDKGLQKLYPKGYRKLEFEDQEVKFDGWEYGREFRVCDLSGDNTLFVLWARKPEAEGNADMGWWAHSCMHIASEVLSNIGMKFSPDSEECYAYLLEWLMTQIIGILWTLEK